MMYIWVNGQKKQVPKDTTVAKLLEMLGLDRCLAAVEHNRQVVSRQAHGQTILAEDDRIEIVTLVGGG